MANTKEKMEQRVRWLDEAAEMVMSLMRAVHQDGMAATEPAERRAACASVDGMARSLRLTVHLQQRLEIAAARAEREAQAQVQAAHQAQVKRKRDRVQKTLERQLRCEVEDESDFLDLCFQLDERMDEEALTDGFLDGDDQQQLTRLAEWLDIAPPRPDDEPHAADPDASSSDATDTTDPTDPMPALEGDWSPTPGEPTPDRVFSSA